MRARRSRATRANRFDDPDADAGVRIIATVAKPRKTRRFFVFLQRAFFFLDAGRRRLAAPAEGATGRIGERLPESNRSLRGIADRRRKRIS